MPSDKSGSEAVPYVLSLFRTGGVPPHLCAALIQDLLADEFFQNTAQQRQAPPASDGEGDINMGGEEQHPYLGHGGDGMQCIA